MALLRDIGTGDRRRRTASRGPPGDDGGSARRRRDFVDAAAHLRESARPPRRRERRAIFCGALRTITATRADRTSRARVRRRVRGRRSRDCERAGDRRRMAIGRRFRERAAAWRLRSDVRAPARRLQCGRRANVLSTTCGRISWQPRQRQRLTTIRQPARQTIRARAAIVTLPVGVLRHTATKRRSCSIPSCRRSNATHSTTSRWATWSKSRSGFASAFWETAARRALSRRRLLPVPGRRSRPTGRSFRCAAN